MNWARCWSGPTAANLGWQVTYLGASLPAAEIAGAAQQRRARAVALSLVYPEDDPRLAGELTRLRESLPAEVNAARRRTRHASLPRRSGKSRRAPDRKPRAARLDLGQLAQAREKGQTMKPFFARNIGNTGRLVRGLGAGLLVGAGFGFFVSVWLGVGLAVGGVFVLFEALRGWCVMRAAASRPDSEPPPMNEFTLQTELWLPRPARRGVSLLCRGAEPGNPHAALAEVRSADARAHRHAARHAH